MNNSIETLSNSGFNDKTCDELRIENFNLRLRCYNYSQKLENLNKAQTNQEGFVKEKELQDIMDKYRFVLSENEILKEKNEDYKIYLEDIEKSLDEKIHSFNKFADCCLINTLEIGDEEICKSVFSNIVQLCTRYMRDSINLKKKNIDYKNKINELRNHLSNVDKNEIKNLFDMMNKSMNISLEINKSQNQNCPECNQLKVLLDRLSEDLIKMSVQYQNVLKDFVAKETEVGKLYEQITETGVSELREEQNRLKKLICASFEKLENLKLKNSEIQHLKKYYMEELGEANDKYSNCKKAFIKSVSRLSEVIGKLIEICKFEDCGEYLKCIEILSKEIEKSKKDPDVLLNGLNDIVIFLKRKFKTNNLNIPSIFQNSNIIHSTPYSTMAKLVLDVSNEIKAISGEEGISIKDDTVEMTNLTLQNNDKSILSFLNKSIHLNPLFQKIEQLGEAIHEVRSSANVIDLNRTIMKRDIGNSPIPFNYTPSLESKSNSTLYSFNREVEHKQFDSLDYETDFNEDKLMKLYHEEKKIFQGEIENLKELIIVKDQELAELMTDKDELKASFNDLFTQNDEFIKCIDEMTEEKKSRLNEIKMLNETIEKLQDDYNKLNSIFEETKFELIEKSNFLSTEVEKVEKLRLEKDCCEIQLNEQKEELQKATSSLQILNKSLSACLERNTECTNYFMDVYLFFCSKVCPEKANYWESREDLNVEKLKEIFIKEIDKRLDTDDRSDSNKENKAKISDVDSVRQTPEFQTIENSDDTTGSSKTISVRLESENVFKQKQLKMKEIIKRKDETIGKLKERLLEYQNLIPCIENRIGRFKEEVNELDGYMQKAVRHVPQSIKRHDNNSFKTQK